MGGNNQPLHKGPSYCKYLLEIHMFKSILALVVGERSWILPRGMKRYLTVQLQGIK